MNKRCISEIRLILGNVAAVRGWIIAFIFLAVLFPHHANNYTYALPTGADIQNGDVTLEQQNSTTLNITASNQSIINWQTFNIAQNETVNFIQPLTSSTVLNRVIGGGMSDIAGVLNANGMVILVNPAGINFAPTANVNVGGLIASSLNISNENFLASNYVFEHFQGLRAGMVINAGHITANRPGAVVGLLGDVVSNEGVIVGELSTIALASGNRVAMKFDESGMIQFDVTEGVGYPQSGSAEVAADSDVPFATAVSNTGTIKAGGGHVILQAEQVSQLFERLINNEGYIEANSVEHGAVAGSVVLKAMSGTVRNAGEIHAEGNTAGSNGGSVTVLGESVTLEHSLINVSGNTGGGTILIGGNYQGKGPEPNALHTYVSADSDIKADAVTYGDGGKVIIWGDESTLYYGSTSAKGGANGGNGGFAEVSSKNMLSFKGTVDLKAPLGMTGTLLLDPRDLTISGAATSGGAFGGGDPNTFMPTANNSVLNDGALETALGSANVIVTTGADGVQAGDITISAVITAPANSNSLTLQAAGDIIINRDIDMSASSGNLTLQADSDASGAGAISRGAGDTILMGTGDLRMTAGSGVGTNNNPILTTGLTDVAAATGTGGIFISNSGSGNINITTISGTAGLATTTGAASTGGNISVVNNVAGGTITVSSAITGGANTAGSTGNVILTTTGGGAANIVVSANITTGNASQVDGAGGQNSVSGSITLTAGGTGSITGTGALTTGSSTFSGAAGGNDAATSGTITLSAGAGMGLSNATALSTGNASRTGGGIGTDTITVGDVFLIAAGEVNNGTASTAMVMTLGTASGGATNNAGNLDLATTGGTGNVFLSTTGAVNFTASSVSNNLSITSGGAMTQTGALTVTGTSSFTAGANAITLTTGTNNFTGAVSLNNSGANNVSVTDTNAIVLGTSSVGTGTLTITAGGNITQSGATTITQAAAAGIASFTAGANAITLTNANNFTGAVALSNSGNNAVAVTDANSIILGTVSVGTSTLAITASGTITQSGVTTITQGVNAGTASFTAGANAITLTNANNFRGPVALSNSGANAVSVTDANAIILGTISVGTSTLTITAGGDITQDGVTTITQAAGAGIASFTAGANVITLTNANNFTGAVALSNSGNNAVAVTDANSIILGTVSVGTSTLAITASGTITQSGVTTITQAAGAGIASFTAGANAITLTNANDFTGAVALSNSGANAVSVTDTNAIILGTISVGTSTLTITAGGNITQSGATTITQAAAAGIASFTAGANAITLTNANNFTGAVALSNSGNNAVAVTDANSIILGTVSVGTSTLTITASGTITQSGVTTITQAAGAGIASFTAGTANDITLNTAANNFSTVAIVSGNNVTLVDAGALDFGTSTISGNYSVTAGGAISQSGALTVTGTTTMTSGAGTNITLTTAGNSFTGNLTLSGADINVSAGATMTLNTITATGAITLTTTTGNIVDGNGAANNLTAAANSALTAGGTIGSALNALEVTITGATLTVSAGGIDTGVSVNINGTVTPSNTLNVPVFPTGQVLFNGSPITPPVPPPPPSPEVSSNMLLGIYNPINQFVDWFGGQKEGDAFFRKQEWLIAHRPRYLD